MYYWKYRWGNYYCRRKINSVRQVQIVNKGGCVLLQANALVKGMNLFLLPPSIISLYCIQRRFCHFAVPLDSMDAVVNIEDLHHKSSTKPFPESCRDPGADLQSLETGKCHNCYKEENNVSFKLILKHSKLNFKKSSFKRIWDLIIAWGLRSHSFW